MGKKLGMCKETTITAIHKLIEVGLIKIAEYGEQRTCHKYKILYSCVPTNEERWRNFRKRGVLRDKNNALI